MLYFLKISNFLSIKHCELNFNDGLSIVTGESGAGKSIIFNAIEYCLGKVGKPDFFYKDERSCVIQCCFSFETPTSSLKKLCNDENQLIITRTFFIDKPSIIKFNDEIVSAKYCKQIVDKFVVIVSQNQQLSILKQSTQLGMIETLCSKNFQKNMQQYTTKYLKYTEKKRELNNLQASTHEMDQQIEFLNFQIEDIKAQQFLPDEDDQLKKIKDSLKNKAHLLKTSSNAKSSLSSATNYMIQFQEDIGVLASNDDFNLDVTKVNHIIDSLENLSSELNTYCHTLDKDSDYHFENIEERLDIIFKYKLKYRQQSINSLLTFYNNIVQKRDGYLNIEETMVKLNQECLDLESECIKLSNLLSNERKLCAKTFESEVKAELQSLNFHNVDFNVEFSQSELSSTGTDHLSFLVSFNKGVSAKPLEKVASGGELSRFLLAVYRVFSKERAGSLFLFDEIDTGIGGLTANNVGNVLKLIAESHQVICITHLAQIARYANMHIVIDKVVENDHSVSKVRFLNETEQSQELKRMVGGDIITSIL